MCGVDLHTRTHTARHWGKEKRKQKLGPMNRRGVRGLQFINQNIVFDDDMCFLPSLWSVYFFCLLLADAAFRFS